jgi:hypothetical protein
VERIGPKAYDDVVFLGNGAQGYGDGWGARDFEEIMDCFGQTRRKNGSKT